MAGGEETVSLILLHKLGKEKVKGGNTSQYVIDLYNNMFLIAWAKVALQLGNRHMRDKEIYKQHCNFIH